jgi:hypothetical protein
MRNVFELLHRDLAQKKQPASSARRFGLLPSRRLRRRFIAKEHPQSDIGGSAACQPCHDRGG